MNTVKGINLKDLKTSKDFEKVFSELQPAKTFKNEGELKVVDTVSSHHSKLEIQLNDNQVVEMSYDEKVSYTQKSKETVILKNDDRTLCITNEKETDCVHYTEHDKKEVGESHQNFIDKLNTRWQKHLHDNLSKVLSYGKDNFVENLETLESLTFLESAYEGSTEGFYVDPWVLNKYQLLISLNGTESNIGTALEFNPEITGNIQRWFSSPRRQYEDCGPSRLLLQSEWNKNLTTVFNLTDTQEECLHELFESFELLKMCREEYELKKVSKLFEELEKVKGYMNSHVVITVSFVEEGIQFSCKEYNTDKEAEEFIKYNRRNEIFQEKNKLDFMNF